MTDQQADPRNEMDFPESVINTDVTSESPHGAAYQNPGGENLQAAHSGRWPGSCDWQVKLSAIGGNVCLD